MSNLSIFKPSRFLLLFKNHFVESRRKYLLFLGSIAALGVVSIILFLMFNNTSYNCYCVNPEGAKIYENTEDDWYMYQSILYWGGMFLFGGLFSFTSFVNFSNQGEAIFYMNKPTSIFEKWLLEVLLKIPLFIAVYSVVFFLLFYPSTLLVHFLEKSSYDYYFRDVKLIKINESRLCPNLTYPVFETSPYFKPWNTFREAIDFRILLVVFAVYKAMIGFFMYGAVLFNKYSIFKTFLLGFAIFLFFLFYGISLLPNRYIVEGWDANLFDTTAHLEKNRDLYVSINETDLMWLFYTVVLLLPTGLLFLSFFKLKEKQI